LLVAAVVAALAEQDEVGWVVTSALRDRLQVFDGGLVVGGEPGFAAGAAWAVAEEELVAEFASLLGVGPVEPVWGLHGDVSPPAPELSFACVMPPPPEP
jgi:hypothetical protein